MVDILGRFCFLHVGYLRSKMPRFIWSNPGSSVIESLVNVVYWFPFYFTFKFVFLLWLSLPIFK
jgi:hypothetical protein